MTHKMILLILLPLTSRTFYQYSNDVLREVCSQILLQHQQVKFILIFAVNKERVTNM